MSDEILVDGTRYISAAQAASTCALSRDYVAKLCREGKVAGKRVGKSWYVSEDSLRSFILEQQAAEARRLETLAHARAEEYRNSLAKRTSVSVSGDLSDTIRDVAYVSAAQAALYSALSRDYVAKLCREGKIEGKRVGKVWYVNENSLKKFILEQRYAEQLRLAALAAARAEEYRSSRQHGGVEQLATGVSVIGEKISETVLRHGNVISGALRGIPSHPGLHDAVLRIAHAPAYSATPVGEALNKLVALATAIVLAIGAYALVDTTYGQAVLASARTTLADVQESYVALVNPEQGDRGERAINALGANVRNSIVLSASAHAAFPDVLSQIARFVNSRVDSLVYAIAFPDALTRSSGSVAVEIQPYARTAISQQPVASGQQTPVARATQSVAQTIIQNPVKERVIERTIERVVPQTIVSAGGISETYLAEKLNQLDNKLTSQMYNLSNANSTAIASNYIVTAQTNRIDQLGDVDISGSRFTGGSITNATISGGTISGVAFTGTATSSFESGINIATGCFAINGACVNGSGSTAASSTLLIDNNTVLGTTTFSGNVTLTNATSTSFFTTVASSTNLFALSASTTRFTVGTQWLPSLATAAGAFLAVDADGKVIATSTPVSGSASSTLLSDNNTFTGTNAFAQISAGTTTVTSLISTNTSTSTFAGGVSATALNITGTAATSTFASGINLAAGCFAIAGSCIGTGSGASLSAANTWTALQTFQAGLISQASSTFSALANFSNASTSLETNTGSAWFTNVAASSLLALDSNNKLVATTSIGTNLLTGSLGTINSTTFNRGDSITITAASSTLLADNNWWTGRQNFTNASTSQLTATSTVYFTGLSASSLLALDANNRVIASTTIGTNLLAGTLATINGTAISANGSATITAASSTLLANSNTWTGLNQFSNATTTLLSGTTAWFTTVNAALVGNASTATALQTARTINGTSFDGTANITITAASSTLLANNNTWTGLQNFANSTSTLATITRGWATNFDATYASSTALTVSGTTYLTNLASAVLGVDNTGKVVATTSIGTNLLQGSLGTINSTTFNRGDSITITAASSTLLADNNTFSGKTILGNATSTTFFATTASSTNLFGQTASVGGLSVTTSGAHFTGTYDGTSAVAGVYAGINGTSRIGFFNGTASENWQIDNSAGIFRWFTTGVERMKLGIVGSNTTLQVPGTNAVHLSSDDDSYFTGSLGIGNTNPSEKLNVQGVVAAQSFNATSSLGTSLFTGGLIVSGTTTLATATSSAFAITSITSSLLSTNANGSVVATSSIGTNLLTGSLGTINGTGFNRGDSITVTAASSTLLANNNTWTGLQNFANSTSTLATITRGWATNFDATYASSTALTVSGTTYLTNLASAVLGVDNTGKVVATSSIGTNLLQGSLGTINSTTFNRGDSITITAASSTLLADSNRFAGSNMFLASTTIGNGAQTGGLTIAGGATTTGNAIFSGTGRFANTLTLSALTTCTGGQGLQTNGSGDIVCGTITTGGASSGGGWTTDMVGNVGLSTTTDRVAIGASTTPYAKLSVLSGAAATTTLALVAVSGQTANILDIYSSSGNLSSVLTAGGNLGLGTTSPGSILSIHNVGNFVASATSTLYNGLSLAALQVSGATTLASTLGVSSLATFSGGATTTGLTATGPAYLTSLTASTLLALDSNKQIVSTTTIGTNLLAGTLATINGTAISANGSATITAASSTLLANSNTWTGLNQFSNATTTLLSGTTAWFTTFNGALVGNASTATALQNARTINGTSFDGTANITITAASSTLLSDNNSFSGNNVFSAPLSLSSTSGTTTIASGQGFTIGSSQFVLQQGSGNVGIGSSTPQLKLVVQGNSAGLGVGSVAIGATTGDNSYGGIYLDGSSGASNYSFRSSQNDPNLYINRRTGSEIRFLENNSTQMVLTSSTGRLGIGTTTPGSLLSVQGVANFNTATSTFYATGGINLAAGCFAIAGTCIGGSSSASSTLLADNNTWTGLNTFANATSTLATITRGWATNFDATYASSTALTVSGTTYLTGLASALLATDATGKVVSTTTIGTNYLTGSLGTINSTTFNRGDSITITAASSTLLANNNTWTGLNSFANSSSTLATLGTTWMSGITNGILSTNAAGQIVASTSIGTNLLTANTISGITLGGTLGALTATDSTLTFSGSYTGATARTVGLNLGNSNWWTATQNFTNASTSQLTATSTVYFTGLSASSLLALDANNRVIASSTIGTNLLTGSLGTVNGTTFNRGDSITITAASSTLLANNNTWTGLNTFANATSTLATITRGWATNFDATYASSTALTVSGTTYLTGLASAVLGVDNTGKVVATSSIGTNLLTGTLATINGTAIPANGSATITAASSTLLANNNTFSGNNVFSAPLSLTSTSGTTTIASGQGFTIGSSQFVVQQGSGNIGIGTAVASRRLTVQVPTGADLFTVDYGTTLANNGGVEIFNRYNNTTDIAGIKLVSAGATTGQVVFATNNAGGGLTERMRITETGNVGIGTSSPTNRFEVAGNTFFGGNLTATGTLAVSGATTLSSTLDVTGKTTLGAASTTNFSNSGSTFLTALTASTLLALDSNKQIVSSTTIGTNLLTGTLGTINSTTFNRGDSITITAASSTLLANNNTWTGLNTFANATSTLATITRGWATNFDATYASSTALTVSGTTYLTGLASALLATDSTGKVVSTTTIGTNYLSGSLGTINSTTFNRGDSITITAASSTLLANNNTFSGNNVFSAPLSLTSTSGTTTIASGQGFTIGSSQFVVQQGSGFVGIGTTSPRSLLSIEGAGAAAATGLPLLSIQTTVDVGTNGNDTEWLQFRDGNGNVRLNIESWASSGNHTLNFESTAGDGSVAPVKWHTDLFRISNGGGAGTLEVGESGDGTFQTNGAFSFRFKPDGTERLTMYNGGNIGISSTTPWGVLSVMPGVSASTTPQFVSWVSGSSTPAFIIASANNNGRVGIGTTTPGTLLSVQGIANFTTATSTFQSSGGINLAAGCFAIAGACVGASGSAASSTLLSDNNTFSGNTTLANATSSTFAITSLAGALLSTNGNGSVVATTSIRTSLLTANTISGIELGSNLAGFQALNTSLTISSGGTYNGSAFRTIALTSRNINGTAFNGTADITITAASSTLLANNNTFSGNNVFSAPLSLTSTSGTTTIASGQGFTIGSSQFVVQQGSGNVGIGTTSPWKMLSVAGDIIGTNLTATGTLAVTGAATLSSTLGVTSLATFTSGFISQASSTISASTAGNLLTIAQGSAWNGSNYALGVTGYANLGGFRINGADTNAGLYQAAANLSFAADTTHDITFKSWDGGSFSTLLTIDGATGNITSAASGANTFPYASSTALTVSGTTYLTGLASALLATDSTGKVVSTTTIGTNYITGSLGTINSTTFNRGDSITITAASSTLLANNNTFSGNNVFSAPLSLTSTSGTTTIASGQGFTIGSSQFVVQQGSGNVGIGTTSPTDSLVGSATAKFAIQDGTSAFSFRSNSGEPYLAITNGTQKVFGGHAHPTDGAVFGAFSNDKLTLRTNNTNRLTIDTSGNVGIGTTTPGSLLSVQGVANFGTATSTFYSTGGINLAGGCFAIAGTCVAQTTAASSTLLSDNNLFSGSNTFSQRLTLSATSGTTTIASGQGFTIGSSQLVLQQGSGNVGIGSAAPAAKLSIANGADDPSNYGKALQITNANGNSQQVAFIRNGNNVVSAGYFGATSIWGFGQGNTTDSGFSPTYLAFDVGNSRLGVNETAPAFRTEIKGTSGSGYFGITNSTDGDILTVNSSGNVGIGTTDPGGKLHIYNSTAISSVGNTASTTRQQWATGNLIYLDTFARRHTAGSDWVGTNLRMQKMVDVTKMGFIDFGIDGVSSDHGIGFGSNATTHLVLTSGGNLGIGTTTPTSLLTVNSGTGNAFQFHRAGTVGGTISGNNGAFHMTTSAFFQWSQGGTDYTPAQTNSHMTLRSGILTVGTSTPTTGGHVNIWGKNGANSYLMVTNVDTANNGSTPNGDIFIINGSGNVGIGTTTPNSKLSVVSGSNATVNLPTGSWAAEIYNQNDASTSGGLVVGNRWYANASTILDVGSVYGGGSAWQSFFTVKGGGNVGVGTTSPYRMFSVSGSAYLAPGTSDQVQIGTRGKLYDDGNFHIHSIDQPVWLNSENSYVAINNQFSGDVLLTNGTGKVGIWQSSPGSALHVGGGAETLTITPTAQIAAASGSSTLAIAAPNAIGASAQLWFENVGQRNWTISSDRVLDALTFGTGGDATRYMTLSSGGNLGIGTTTPGSLLSVQGIANFTTATSTFYSTGGINLAGGCFAIAGTCVGGGSGSASSTLLSDNNTFSGSNTFSQRLTLSATTGTTTIASGQGFTIGTSQFVLQQGSGNVGIGTASPGEKLDIAGNARISQSNYLKFAHSGESDANDGKIGAGIFSAGLNIVGIRTDGTARKVSYWGSLLQQSGDNNSFLGNVGIGTTSPAGLLHVDGTSGALILTSTDAGGTETTDARGVVFRSSSYRMGDYASRLVKADEGSGIPLYVQSNESGDKTTWVNTARFGSYTGNSNKFETFGATALATASGSVGIGTTSPATTLSVGGSGYLTGGLGVGLLNTSAGTIRTTGNATFGGGRLTLDNGTSNTMFFGTNGVAAPGAGSAGAKISLYGTAGSFGASDYGLGIESSTLWMNSDSIFKWYVDSVAVAQLTSSGLAFSAGAARAITGPSDNELDINAGGSNVLDLNNGSGGSIRAFVDHGSGSELGLLVYDYAGSSNDYLSLSHSGSAASIRTSATADHLVLQDAGGKVGIGTTTPWGTLSVDGGTAASGNGAPIVLAAQNGQTSNPFLSTNGGNILLLPGAKFSDGVDGRVGIGTTTPGTLLSVQGIANFGTATSTFYSSGGINLTSGCFAVNGTCLRATGAVPAFYAHKNGTNQTVTTATITLLTWSNEDFDTNNNFDLTTERFTPTVAGKYVFTASAYCLNSTGCYIYIYKNGAETTQGGSGAAETIALTTAVLDMNGSSDYVEAHVYSSTGTTIRGNTDETYFTGSRLQGADYAEYVDPVAGTDAADYPVGSLICIKDTSPDTYGFCDGAGDSMLIGAISDNPAVTGNDVASEQATELRAMWRQSHILLSMVGRVPMRVSLENGPIAIGDRIAQSSVSGVGMKARATDTTVGRALSDYATSTAEGHVMVFIDPQQHVDVESIGMSLLGVDQATSSTTTQPFDFVDSLISEIANRLSPEIVAIPGATSTAAAAAADGFFSSLFERFIEWFASAANGIVDFFANRVHTKELCIGDEEGNETCLTKTELDALLAGAAFPSASASTSTPSESTSGGAGEEAEGSSATTTPDTIAPVITINGANPAEIAVGTAYSDLGATVTDNVDTNLGIKASVDGGDLIDLSAVSLDTSAPGSHTILYSATDNAGNTATAERTVLISGPELAPPPAEEPPATDPEPETPSTL